MGVEAEMKATISVRPLMRLGPRLTRDLQRALAQNTQVLSVDNDSLCRPRSARTQPQMAQSGPGSTLR